MKIHEFKRRLRRVPVLHTGPVQGTQCVEIRYHLALSKLTWEQPKFSGLISPHD